MAVRYGYSYAGFDWYGPEVEQMARRSAGLGVKAGLIFAAGRIKQTLSIPAPRKRLKNKTTGVVYYVATEPAQKGAPPRKLSGRLRASIAWEYDFFQVSGRVGTNVKYAPRLERQEHRFLMKTIELIRAELGYIIGTRAVSGNSGNP